ncbi:MAG: MMPL family transporter [Candidatus Dormibacteraeota bacterium]|nr:MMPL family transporter [Candidatus Dormibacteraeota bacterium]
MNVLASLVTGRRSRWVLIVVWLVGAIALVPFSSKLTAVEQNSQSSFVPSGAPSTIVANIEGQFPSLNRLAAIVVLYRKSGVTSSDLAYARAAQARVQALGLAGETGVTTPALSPNHDGVLIEVSLGANTSATKVAADVSQLRASLAGHPAGLEVGVGGPAAILADTASAFAGIDGILLAATVLVVAVLLLLTYRSLFLWLFPLITVGLATLLGQAGVYLLARGGFVVNGMTIGILTVLMFGAGTDYSLLLVARYREELRSEPQPSRAMAIALERVAPTLAVSASTVILSLLVLLAAQERDIRALGPVGAIGIAAVLLGSLTLLPPLLLTFGRSAFWPLVPRVGQAPRARRVSWSRTAAWVAAHPGPLSGAGIGALALLCLGLLAYPPSLPQSKGFSGQVPSARAQTLISSSFPAGSTGPVVVATRNPALLPEAESLAAGVKGIAAVGQASVHRGAAVFQATLASAPDGTRAESVVAALRSTESRHFGNAVLVGGPTAVQIDLNQAASHDRLVVIPIVLLVVLVMLGLLLRSVLAPVLLTASVVLSFLAALGLSSLAVRSIFGFAGMDSSVALLGFVFLVALGVDYTVFLASRIRQEVTGDPQGGVEVALGATGGVITSAGMVLAATFTVLGVLPLVALTELGFLVAVGVLLDTFVVRSLVVPAVALLLGDRFWWPWAPSAPAKPGGARST